MDAWPWSHEPMPLYIYMALYIWGLCKDIQWEKLGDAFKKCLADLITAHMGPWARSHVPMGQVPWAPGPEPKSPWA